MDINIEKMDGYLRDNGGLTLKQALKFNYWSFFNFKKCQYFYYLCETGCSNLKAFNLADRQKNSVINKILLQNKSKKTN